MWKILFLTLMILVSGSFGLVLSSNLKLRRKNIDGFLYGIRMVESEMQYETAALSICFQRAGESLTGALRELFLDTAERIRENGSGEEAFLASLQDHRAELAFTEKDLESIKRFANGLGEKDLEQALKDLNCLKERMKESMAEASRNEDKWGRLFQHAGWLVGICIALIFI